MIKKTSCSGRRVTLFTALVPCCLFYATHALAWQQEYVSDAAVGDQQDRYTWDSDRAPNYNDVLAERIHSSMTPEAQEGLMFAAGSDTASADSSRLDIGWNIPVMGNVTTGPTAGYSWDGSSTSIYNEYGDSILPSSYNDQLWHASVSTVGWRLDSSVGYVRPWAQLSYNRQFGDNVWKAQSGMRTNVVTGQDASWMDVTVGADMPIGKNVAAFASMSQAEGLSTGDAYLYNLGVSAKF
ncbi:autotransporter domain-containing protein [Enterobacteriaceae bacterium H11S18]|uniref:autotransporter domain-containing protein n=1 Tax=Dryocola clanedunensis TaxID=2925396 RepID=UPI0022F14281|nr:autotransporter domain-containing protein [Dryocola clanedunensis]MCT4704882.1 autotransporter domain-containing protein [Dryocola clanedunensis]MCT4712032.1 autotransporter domain-containing protein [Dryocola clanedunensis]